MRNVPVDVAGAYLGVSGSTIRNALKGMRAPFGAALRGEKGNYIPCIPGPALVKFRNEGAAISKWSELQEMMDLSMKKAVSELLYEVRRIEAMKT